MIGRLLVVLVIAGVGYQEVIPVSHYDRARLSRLVAVRPGLTEFNTKPARAGTQSASATGLVVLNQMNKASPNRTGIYASEWTGKGAKADDAAELVAFLTPNNGDARRLQDELVTTELSAKAQSTDKLARLSTFSVPGIPGSAGSTYRATKPTATSADLAVSVFRSGCVVGLVEAATRAGTQADVVTMSKSQDTQMRRVEVGFTLKVVHHPLLASAVWVTATIALALIAAFGPIGLGRLRGRRQRRRQEELDRLVRGHPIIKQRRPAKEAGS